MAVSLARDKLNYSPTQIDDLSDKLLSGDFTPVLQIFEDIMGPARSAVPGTLLRSALVQVERAKVRPFARVCCFLLMDPIFLGGRRPGTRRDR